MSDCQGSNASGLQTLDHASRAHSAPGRNSAIGRWIKDPFCGLSHWLGALLAIGGLFALIAAGSGSAWRTTALVIYGVSLILLFTSSALAHSIRCSAHIEQRLTRLDCAAIFLLIAGTYTPVCLISLRGPWGYSLLIGEWTLALVGAFAVLFGRGRSTLPRTLIYLGMGWMGLIAGIPVIHVLSAPALAWLFAGGAAYSIGAVIFVLNRPHLWPGRFVAHDLWHVMVLVGSACHFVMILCFVA